MTESKGASVLGVILTVLAAVIPIEMGNTTRLILMVAFGVLAGLSAALHAAAGKGITVLGVVTILFGTVSAPEVTSLWATVLSPGAAETFARIVMIAGAVLTGVGAPIWKPTFPGRT